MDNRTISEKLMELHDALSNWKLYHESRREAPKSVIANLNALLHDCRGGVPKREVLVSSANTTNDVSVILIDGEGRHTGISMARDEAFEVANKLMDIVQDE